jgi:methionyl-tRNA formyltransferase
MEKKDLKIVFMGTPDFAVESLRALVQGGYQVVGAVTMPDKPVGKHHSRPQPSPVKQYALSQHIPLLQPERLKDPAFLDALRSWNADLQIVVAFRMLPEVVWNMPPLGTFNLHASLLPRYRGAAPINWAIINGETETGVTTFFLTHEIDAGRVIFQRKTPIRDQDTFADLHDRLMILGAGLVVETVDAILHDSMVPIDQQSMIDNRVPLQPAPKIFKETCRIDWSKDVKAVYNFVRGLSPSPGAWSDVVMPNGTVSTLKIFETATIRESHPHPPGYVRTDHKTFLDIASKDGYVRLLSLQQAGKKRMSTGDFLRGYKTGQ